MKDDLPMGVSQWREHGKKYGYWDFFTAREIEEFIERLREMRPDLIISCLCLDYSVDCSGCGFKKSDEQWQKLKDDLLKEYETFIKKTQRANTV